jgi:hypothetical protein
MSEVVHRKSAMPDNRGFDKSRLSYTTRTGEEVRLTDQEYRILTVLDDVVNRHLFVNTRDLRKSIDSSIEVSIKRRRRDDDSAV